MQFWDVPVFVRNYFGATNFSLQSRRKYRNEIIGFYTLDSAKLISLSLQGKYILYYFVERSKWFERLIIVFCYLLLYDTPLSNTSYSIAEIY